MCSEFYFDLINIVENNILHYDCAKIIFYSVFDSTTKTDLLWWNECSKFKSLCTWKLCIWWLCMLIIVQCSNNSLWSDSWIFMELRLSPICWRVDNSVFWCLHLRFLNFGIFTVYRFQVKPIHISMSGGYVTGIVFEDCHENAAIQQIFLRLFQCSVDCTVHVHVSWFFYPSIIVFVYR